MFCGKCGFENAEGALVCSSCGDVLTEATAQEASQPAYQAPAQPAYQAPVQPAYQQPVYQPAYQPAYQQPVYQQPVQQVIPEGYSETVSVGDWVGSMLLMCIPIVGLILLFVWAFGGAKPSKANYFKACLLIALISIGISLVVGVFFGLVLGGF